VIKKKVILLTRVPGWLGNRLLELLLERRNSNNQYWSSLGGAGKIRCLVFPDQRKPALEDDFSAVEFLRGDITVKSSLKEFFQNSEGSLLIHLAGIIHPSLWTKEFYAINVTGTEYPPAGTRA